MRYTEAPARRDELLRRLGAEGYVSSAGLAAEFGVSEMTIRRDLRQLATEGLARRVPGGASLPGADGVGVPFEERDRSGGVEKRLIAAACLPLLDGAVTVGLDAGTTVAPLARLLAPGTRVVTHSAPVISACTQRDDVDLVAVGGEYQPTTRSFAGSLARHSLEALSLDIAVLSATALDRSGLLCANTLDAEVKQAMAASARMCILLADASKLGARAPIRFGALDLVDVLVTDDRAEPHDLALLRGAGLHVIVAETGAADAVVALPQP